MDWKFAQSQIKSLDIVWHYAFRKIFLNKSYDVANECILRFNCSVSDTIYRRKLKFLTQLQLTEIGLCKHFVKNIDDERATVHESVDYTCDDCIVCIVFFS